MKRKTNGKLKQKKTGNENIAKQNGFIEGSSVVRNYKDTIFRMIYRDKKELLALYNAVNGTHYDNPDELEITTLENAIYMNMKNDVSCIMDMRMNLYEHQSTVNPNIPLRDLFYVARLYEKLTIGKDIYSSKRIMLPTPKFITFYNGANLQPERKIMKLSDSFQREEDVNLELIVIQLNINPGYNEELKAGCPSLYQYMCYVEKVRTYKEEMPIESAVTIAVDECIAEDILADFFRKNKAEAIQMSIFEYDEELHKKTLLEEGFEKGLERGRTEGKAEGKAEGMAEGKAEGRAEGMAEGKVQGKAEAILNLLEDLGAVPSNVEQTICAEKDMDILKKWLKLAAKVDSVEEFIQVMADSKK